jgi:uncharacterized membrane protein YedE/YeeE
MDFLNTFYASPFAPLAGGVIIGLAASMLWLLHGRIAGISGITGGLFDAPSGDKHWRLSFVLGLVAGGVLFSFMLPGAFGTAPVSLGVAVIAGVLVGFGTTLANGCTSGHGVCGVGRFSKRSLVATASFMSAGMLAVYAVRRLVEVSS